MSTSAQIEAAAKAVYDLDPFIDGGEYVDGFSVSPGGALTWEQAKARDAEFAPEYMLPITKFAYDAARAALAACAPSERDVARAVCKSRTCEGVDCCQWPANRGRVKCPVAEGKYDDAARSVLALLT